MKFSTRAIHIGEEPDFREGSSGDVVIPIHLSTTFARKDVEVPTGGYEYSRTGNPTRFAFEKKIASLENGKFGLAFSSGMAAESTVAFSLLKSGDHIIAFDDLYGGTKRLFNKVLNNFNIEVSYVDLTNPSNLEAAIKPNTRMVWIETPTNPLMKLCDISEISRIAKKYSLIVVVDNTFMTPYFQKPLDLGADVVVHSCTKYISGHSDVVAGAVVVNDEEIRKKIRFNQNAIGAVPSPFDCYLLIRGLKTLHVRMERHEYNAKMIASFLSSHPKVEKVLYPGLESHPQHDLAKKQMSGFGGMISFYLKADANGVKRFLSSLNVFLLAESLGGVESLINNPSKMTHASIPEEERKKIGITNNLIRISVGIEDVEDLIADLDNALKSL